MCVGGRHLAAEQELPDAVESDHGADDMHDHGGKEREGEVQQREQRQRCVGLGGRQLVAGACTQPQRQANISHISVLIYYTMEQRRHEVFVWTWECNVAAGGMHMNSHTHEYLSLIHI